ncbi:MAG: hypothetical protein AB7J28_08770 [Hyphomonadaceae bacterium]
MRLAAALLALAAASCTELPDQGGVEIPCTEISAEEYAQGRASGAWREIDVRNGFDGEGALHDRRRCWPRGIAAAGSMRENRRCVQRNDLVVRLTDPAGVAHYRIPVGETYMLYGSEGRAICSVIEGGGA